MLVRSGNQRFKSQLRDWTLGCIFNVYMSHTAMHCTVFIAANIVQNAVLVLNRRYGLTFEWSASSRWCHSFLLFLISETYMVPFQHRSNLVRSTAVQSWWFSQAHNSSACHNRKAFSIVCSNPEVNKRQYAHFSKQRQKSSSVKSNRDREIIIACCCKLHCYKLKRQRILIKRHL